MQKTFDKKRFLSQNSIWLVLIALVIIMSIAQPTFFSVGNLLTLLSGEAVKGIMAFGVMFAILSKGIDLTIGASAALVACITASLVQPADYANAILPGVGPLPAPVVILIGLALGAGIGAIYGAIIAYTKIPPFIATLGAQLICRAGAKMYTNRPVSNLSEDFRFLGSYRIGGVFPVIILVFFVMFAISAGLCQKSGAGSASSHGAGTGSIACGSCGAGNFTGRICFCGISQRGVRVCTGGGVAGFFRGECVQR